MGNRTEIGQAGLGDGVAALRYAADATGKLRRCQSTSILIGVETGQVGVGGSVETLSKVTSGVAVIPRMSWQHSQRQR